MSEQSEKYMREAMSMLNWYGGAYSDDPVRRHQVNEAYKTQAIVNAYTGRGHISPEAFCYPGFNTLQVAAQINEGE